MLEPHSSNFRVITTNFLGVRIFRKFTVYDDRIKDSLFFKVGYNFRQCKSELFKKVAFKQKKKKKGEKENTVTKQN